MRKSKFMFAKYAGEEKLDEAKLLITVWKNISRSSCSNAIFAELNLNFNQRYRKHYLTRHQKKFEKNSKLDKLSKAEYYESLETDFPDPLLDISTLPLEELNRKAKFVKGKHFHYNHET